MSARKPLWIVGLLVCVALSSGCADDDDGLGVPIVRDTMDSTDGDIGDISDDLPVECSNPPNVTIGGGGDAQIGDAGELSGDASDPDEGDVLRVRWSQSSGPAVDISDENALDTSFDVSLDEEDAGESLAFELEVCDACDQCVVESVRFTVVPE